MLPSAGTGVALTGGYHAVANKVIINYFAGGKKKMGKVLMKNFLAQEKDKFF